jgi:hypothetical protein
MTNYLSFLDTLKNINVRYFNAFNKKTSYEILRFTFETTINSSSALF